MSNEQLRGVRVGPQEGEKGNFDRVMTMIDTADDGINSLRDTGRFLLPGNQADWGSLSYWKRVAEVLQKDLGSDSASAKEAAHIADILRMTLDGEAKGIQINTITQFKQRVEEEWDERAKKAA